MRRSTLALLQVKRLNQPASLRGLYLSKVNTLKKKHSVGISSQTVGVMTLQSPNRRSAPKVMRPRCAGRQEYLICKNEDLTLETQHPYGGGEMSVSVCT